MFPLKTNQNNIVISAQSAIFIYLFIYLCQKITQEVKGLSINYYYYYYRVIHGLQSYDSSTIGGNFFQFLIFLKLQNKIQEFTLFEKGFYKNGNKTRHKHL